MQRWAGTADLAACRRFPWTTNRPADISVELLPPEAVRLGDYAFTPTWTTAKRDAAIRSPPDASFRLSGFSPGWSTTCTKDLGISPAVSQAWCARAILRAGFCADADASTWPGSE
jgi:hypothetical protein